MEGFPSGQREQTVNLSSMTSVVRIHHLPPKQKDIPKGMSFFCFGGRWLWIRKPALRNVPVARFNRRGLPVGRQPLKYLMVVPAAKRIHHRTGRHACSSKMMGLHQTLKLTRALNGAPALRNVPVARFNRRGLPVGRQPLKYLMVVPAAKRIHHRTGRQACGSAVVGLHQPITAGARPIRREEQIVFDSEINLHRRLQRYIAVCDVIP